MIDHGFKIFIGEFFRRMFHGHDRFTCETSGCDARFRCKNVDTPKCEMKKKGRLIYCPNFENDK